MLKMLQQLKEWQQRVKSGGGSLADSPDVPSLQRTERHVSVRILAVRSACPSGAVGTDISCLHFILLVRSMCQQMPVGFTENLAICMWKLCILYLPGCIT
jgi:hypothetical protein